MRYEYIAPSGEYGRLEETLNFYGNLGWELISVDLHFPIAQTTIGWVAVLKREIAPVPAYEMEYVWQDTL